MSVMSTIPYFEDPTVKPLQDNDIPQFHKLLRTDAKLLAQAVAYGQVKLGHTVKEYMADAFKNFGFECVYIWGFQGSKKSNLTLQHGYWMYEDWDKVLKYLALRPGKGERGFQAMLKNIGEGRRIPWVGWDDMAVNYTMTAYKTDIAQYQAIDSLFACARTKTNVIACNSPVIERIPKNIRDNISIEIFTGRNQRVMTERICRLLSFNKLESYFFKIPIEPPYEFDWRLVPPDVWAEYEELRNRLTEETIQKLGEAYKDESLAAEDGMPLHDIIAQGIATPGQLNSYCSRDFISMYKVGGERYISRKDVENFLMKIPKRKTYKTAD